MACRTERRPVTAATGPSGLPPMAPAVPGDVGPGAPACRPGADAAARSGPARCSGPGD